MTDALAGLRRKLWSLRSCSACGRCPVPGQGCCARWCNDCRSRNAWYDYGYMLSPRVAFGRIFTFFLVMGLIRLLSLIHVLLFWPAHRRQRLWHVPYWFCWFDAPRAMFPRLPAVCREVYNQCFGCLRDALGNLYIISTSLLYLLACSASEFLRELIFWNPRALTVVSARGPVVPESLGVYSQVTRHRVCQFILRCCGHTHSLICH